MFGSQTQVSEANYLNKAGYKAGIRAHKGSTNQSSIRSQSKCQIINIRVKFIYASCKGLSSQRYLSRSTNHNCLYSTSCQQVKILFTQLLLYQPRYHAQVVSVEQKVLQLPRFKPLPGLYISMRDGWTLETAYYPTKFASTPILKQPILLFLFLATIIPY